MASLAEGEVFAGYEIVRSLGSGGMGDVYLAAHPRLPRQDALMILRSDDNASQKINGVITRADPPWQPDWWAFQSSCGATGCVATAVQLDANNITVPTNVTDVLHVANGQWHSAPDELLVPTCRVTRNGVTGPKQFPTNRYTKTWTPQPDGSLRGVWGLKVISNECEQQGRTLEVGSAARIGDI